METDRILNLLKDTLETIKRIDSNVASCLEMLDKHNKERQQLRGQHEAENHNVGYRN